MKKLINGLLVAAVIVPLVLLFWPFALWNDAMALLLRVIPALALQAWLCRVSRTNFVKAIPLLPTGAFAAWGTYLYFTSPHWSNATLGGLIADNVSPFICCCIVFVAYQSAKKRR